MKDEIAKFQAVLLKFDEYILEKVNKKAFQEFKTDCDESFLRKEEVRAFRESVIAEQKGSDDKIASLEE